MTQQRGPRGRGPARGARSETGARSASRPAAARRAAAAGAATRTSAPRPRRLTGRAAVLIVVLVALALGYTYPVRVYLSQQAEIGRMRASQEEQRTRIALLELEAAKWEDEEYVRIQARRRLYYVRPGEIPLVVLWDEAGAARDAGRSPPPPKPTEPPPWYGTLWSSIQAANG